MKMKIMLGFATVFGFYGFGQTAFATDLPLDCDLPLDVYEATASPVPEGIVYEYITDEHGNFILVDGDGNPVSVDDGFIVDGASNPDLTEAYDPHGDQIPEDVFFSPSLLSQGTWFEKLFLLLFGFLDF